MKDPSIEILNEALKDAKFELDQLLLKPTVVEAFRYMADCLFLDAAIDRIRHINEESTDLLVKSRLGNELQKRVPGIDK